MKKIRIISITIVIVLLGAILSIYMNKPKSIAKSTELVTLDEDSTVINKGTVSEIPYKDLTFAVLWDIHENIVSFTEVINDLYTINPGMDALVLNGDTVDQGNEEQYEPVKNTISKNKDLLPKTIIKIP